MIDLDGFAAAVGTDGPVTIRGASTRGGPIAGVRAVGAPAGIVELHPDEMTVRCGAATRVDELVAALADHGQTVALPPGGTVGGALSVGQSDIRRLGWGPIRDTLLGARFVSAAGRVISAGGPTVKNVSGFDICRLLVGARGTLGFLGEVILRTRPLAQAAMWASAPAATLAEVDDRIAPLYRPTSVLWNGESVWVLVEGHPRDVEEQLVTFTVCSGPPSIPTGGRRSLAPADLGVLEGDFVAEIGVGVVHLPGPCEPPERPARLAALGASVKAAFDPAGRLNPGIDV